MPLLHVANGNASIFFDFRGGTAGTGGLGGGTVEKSKIVILTPKTGFLRKKTGRPFFTVWVKRTHCAHYFGRRGRFMGGGTGGTGGTTKNDKSK